MYKTLKNIEKTSKNIVSLLLRPFIHNVAESLPIEKSKIKKILLLRTDRIGDMAVTTPLIRALKKCVPGVLLYMFVSEANASLIKQDPDISFIYIKKKNLLQTIWQIFKCRQEKPDVLINLNLNRSFSNAVISHFSCPSGIKVASHYNSEYSNYYNYLHKVERNNTVPMAKLLLEFLTIFGDKVAEEELKLSLSVSDRGKQNAKHILKELSVHPSEYILLNISSRHKNRNTTDEFIIKIIVGLTQVSSEPILLISDPAQRIRLNNISAAANSARVKIVPNIELETLTALIAKAKMVITPDTAIVHIACGVDVPVAAFYTRGETFYREWQPVGVPNVMIFPDGDAHVTEIKLEVALEKITRLYVEIS